MDRACFIWRWLPLAAWVAAAIGAAAADAKSWPQDFAVRRWMKEDGLPDNAVTAVLQTRDGYLWVGTSAGLARFDGVKFELIGLAPAKSNDALHVTALGEDADGRLWIGTQDAGLLWFADDTVRRFRGSERLLDRTVNCIAEGRSGELWLGTPSGLDRLNGPQVTHFTTRDGLPNDFVSGVHVTRSGTVLITTRSGLCQYKGGQVQPVEFQTDSPGRSPEPIGAYEDRQTNLWAFGDTYLVNLSEGKRFNYFGGGSTSSERIWSLSEGREGQLWIGTSGQGLISFANGKFVPLSLRQGRLSSGVRALCEDREGNVWLGTSGDGLVRLQPRFARVLEAGAGLPAGAASCLAFGADGRLWVGYEQGGLYSGTADRFEPDAGSSGFDAQNLVSTLALAPDGGLWLGTLGTGLYRLKDKSAIHFTTANGLSDDAILAVAAEPDGSVWIGTRSGKLHRFAANTLTTVGEKAGLPGEPISALLPGRGGGLWVGTERGTLLRGDRGRFVPVNLGARADQAVRALQEDTRGRLWVGTAGGGLACGSAGDFLRWDTKRGFPDDWVYSLLSDAEGNLWLGTGKGIYRLARADLKTLGQASPPARLMLESEPASAVLAHGGWPGAARSPDGRLWFATLNGLVTFDPRGLALDVSAPPVYIERVFVNGRPLPPVPTAGAHGAKVPPVRLPSDLRSLEIQFTALHLASPEKVRFLRKLEGLDADWVDAGAERRVRYDWLPYGEYRFRVKACNADGVWNETGATLDLVLPPPMWRSRLAMGVYALLAAGFVAGSARWVSYRRLRRKLARLAQQQAMQKERMRIAQDMHDEIGSKLTKISFLSERAKGELRGQEPVGEKLNSIAGTSRDLLQALDEIVWAVNPHNDTLEHLAAYLGHYATEYLQNTAVECELHIPRNLPDHPLSAEVRHNLFLAFEEALNNALKHARASRVRVAMTAGRARFEITLTDNGRGFEAGPAAPGNRGGNGLPNMRQRLADVGGQCTVTSVLGQGTTVRLGISLASGAKENS